MQPSFKEQRRFNWVPVRIPVFIAEKSAPNKKFEGQILDISVGGAFVHCAAPIKVGHEILITIEFRDTRIIEALIVEEREVSEEKVVPGDIALLEAKTEKSLVRWARGSSNTGFGVEFLSLNDDSYQFLLRLTQYCEALLKSGVS